MVQIQSHFNEANLSGKSIVQICGTDLWNKAVKQIYGANLRTLIKSFRDQTHFAESMIICIPVHIPIPIHIHIHKPNGRVNFVGILDAWSKKLFSP